MNEYFKDGFEKTSMRAGQLGLASAGTIGLAGVAHKRSKKRRYNKRYKDYYMGKTAGVPIVKVKKIGDLWKNIQAKRALLKSQKKGLSTSASGKDYVRQSAPIQSFS